MSIIRKIADLLGKFPALPDDVVGPMGRPTILPPSSMMSSEPEKQEPDKVEIGPNRQANNVRSQSEDGLRYLINPSGKDWIDGVFLVGFPGLTLAGLTFLATGDPALAALGGIGGANLGAVAFAFMKYFEHKYPGAPENH